MSLTNEERDIMNYDVIYDVSREDLEALKPVAYELIQKIEQLLKEQ